MAVPTTAYPGLVLGPAKQYTAGPGTHIYEGSICASVVGQVTTQPPGSSGSLPLLAVARPAPSTAGPASRSIAGAGTLPHVGSIVLGRVTRLQARQINLAILVVDDAVCADAFQGIVRREDVRGWEVDKVVVGESFRVGDVVRGVVVCLRWTSGRRSRLTLINRSRWVIRLRTTSARLAMSWVFCLLRAKLAIRCILLAGRPFGIPRRARRRLGRWPSQFELYFRVCMCMRYHVSTSSYAFVGCWFYAKLQYSSLSFANTASSFISFLSL